jgi:prepilin signal peptidase PulO-like enzyme (type II secretory pathway)
MIYGIAVFLGLLNYVCLAAGIADPGTEEKRPLWEEVLPKTRKKIIAAGINVAAAVLFGCLFSFYEYVPVKIAKYCLLMGGMEPIAYVDRREKRIPNGCLLYLIAVRLILFGVECFSYPSLIRENIIFTVGGAVVAGVVMFFAYVLSRHAIGMGDIKLLMVMGLYVGAQLTYLLLLAALILAACYGGVKVLTKRLEVKDEIAFAPFIALGTIIILGLGF